MTQETFFASLDSKKIADMIQKAHKSVCYAAPSIQIEPAEAMAEVSKKLGKDMVTLCVDFDERVMRMGYGDMSALRLLREAGIVINNVPGLRMAVIIVDEEGFVFTPTALYLEAENGNKTALNAMRLNRSQAAEALARLSHGTKIIAEAMATSPEEREHIVALPVEVDAVPVTFEKFDEVDVRLKEAPPVKFDVARQVRVFEPYFQYVELSLTGAAIQRNRLTIPPSIQALGIQEDMASRLHTTFELIENNSQLSSKKLEKELNEIRKNFTPALGNGHGRVALKAAKPHLEKRLDAFRKTLENHQKTIKEDLEKHIEDALRQIVDYYAPFVMKNPPDYILGRLIPGLSEEELIKKWIRQELDRICPKAESLIQKMQLDVRYKDVTFETLNQEDFLKSIKSAFPDVDWDKAYHEFQAAGESRENGAKNHSVGN